MTTQLSWHVQNRDLIEALNSTWKQMKLRWGLMYELIEPLMKWVSDKSIVLLEINISIV